MPACPATPARRTPARLRPLLSALFPAARLLAALLPPLFLLSAPARAATLTVTNTNDGGAGSLRQAVADSASGDTITFQAGGTITLTTGQITLTHSLTLAGPGAAALAVDGGGASRVFGITGGTVAISGLTVQRGSAASGGGIQNSATLTLSGCVLTGNSAARSGGGVQNGGTLTMAGCTLSGNTVTGSGGTGGGAENDGTLTMVGCTLHANTVTPSGGGVYNAGILSMAGCTLSGNAADRGDSPGVGGGVDSFGSTAALSGCTFAGNTAHGFGGGAAVTSGILTLSGCTFSGNTADAGGGGGVYGGVNDGSGDGPRLTDDVLYGDAGGELAVGAGTATAAYCDVQGGIDGHDAANHVLNVDPLFVSAAAPYDLHLQSASPVIAQGTAAATADHDGKPYFTPPALGAYEGPQDVTTDTHVLWDSPDGRVIFWDVNARGGRLVAGVYGPYADDASGGTAYTATSLATGPDGVSYVLWTNPARVTYLWAVQPDGRHVDSLYGPFSDDGTRNTLWSATAVSVGGDGTVHLLWSNPNGRTILWDVDAATGAFTIKGNYAPQAGYAAVSLATGADGLSHILWNGAGGLALLWNLDVNAQPTAFTYGPFSDDGTQNTLWSARALSAGPDNVPHVLWDNPSGRTILWNVDARGGYTIAGNYGPFQDDASGQTSYTAVVLATGADGLSHLAWDNPDGNTFLWSVNPDGTHADTFYPPFYDGPGASVWKAVAVSSAP